MEGKSSLEGAMLKHYLKLGCWVAIAGVCLPQCHMEQRSQRVSVKYSFDLGIDRCLICVWRITVIFITDVNNGVFSWAKHLGNQHTFMVSLNSLHRNESVLWISQLFKIWEPRRLLWGYRGNTYIWGSNLGLISGPEFPTGLCHTKQSNQKLPDISSF